MFGDISYLDPLIDEEKKIQLYLPFARTEEAQGIELPPIFQAKTFDLLDVFPYGFLPQACHRSGLAAH